MIVSVCVCVCVCLLHTTKSAASWRVARLRLLGNHGTWPQVLRRQARTICLGVIMQTVVSVGSLFGATRRSVGHNASRSGQMLCGRRSRRLLWSRRLGDLEFGLPRCWCLCGLFFDRTRSLAGGGVELFWTSLAWLSRLWGEQMGSLRRRRW